MSKLPEQPTLLKSWIPWEAAASRAVEKIHAEDDQLLIVFDDDTFTTVQCERGYDDDIEMYTDGFCYLEWNPTTLINAGLVDGEDVARYNTEIQEAAREKTRNERYRQYEQLRKEFDTEMPIRMPAGISWRRPS